jgi:hypothetical protein
MLSVSPRTVLRRIMPIVLARLYEALWALQHQACRVESTDTLRRLTDTPIPNLTIEAQLLYAADLSTPHSVPAAAKATHVNGVIQLLGLESVRKRQIGCAWTPRISGWSQSGLSTQVSPQGGVLMFSKHIGLAAASSIACELSETSVCHVGLRS